MRVSPQRSNLRRPSRRGAPDLQMRMLSSFAKESLIPADHPIRRIRKVVDTVLAELDPEFTAMYSEVGRPSIPPGATAQGDCASGHVLGTAACGRNSDRVRGALAAATGETHVTVDSSGACLQVGHS
jgi:hypothetical protein